jgi:hypothetical protein
MMVEATRSIAAGNGALTERPPPHSSIAEWAERGSVDVILTKLASHGVSVFIPEPPHWVAHTFDSDTGDVALNAESGVRKRSGPTACVIGLLCESCGRAGTTTCPRTLAFDGC